MPNNDYLYVAPTLDYFFMIRHPAIAKEITRDGLTYRRLDGQYYAWLRHRFDLWFESTFHTKTTREEADHMLNSMAFIVDFAEQRVGKEKLKEIMKSFDPKKYLGPGQKEKNDTEKKTTNARKTRNKK